MCGIAGFNWRDPILAVKMADALKHRGPDDQGLYYDEHVSLAHRRLSILDLSDRGHQPMHYMDLVIVHNGEVYNFRQIRLELEGLGYAFQSNTDTEVVAAAYHKWGPQCLHRFNGMWAFCIYNTTQQNLFLARDRFGVKPLYYYFDGNRFIFASQLNALLAHQIPKVINHTAINFFFYQKYIGSDCAIFDNVHKLEPGCYLSLDLAAQRLHKCRYYDIEEQIEASRDLAVAERVEIIERILFDAVEARLIADVPVGSFLSGGIDSSLVSAIISRKSKAFKTFSIGFKEASYNELIWSRLVSRRLSTDHHYQVMDLDEQVIRTVLQAMDEPFGDASVIPTFLLCSIARSRVTVCLSGDGADEVFAGYDTYKGYLVSRFMPGWLTTLLRPLVLALPDSDRKVTLTFKAKRYLRDIGTSPVQRHMDWMATFLDRQRMGLLTTGFVPSEEFIKLPERTDLLGLQLTDIRYYLPGDILKKVDMASMLHSLEVRVPYLDYRLVPLVLSLPSEYLACGLKTKRLLRKIARRYLPYWVIHRPKRGFTCPISAWIRSSKWIQQCICSEGYLSHGLLERKMVARMLDEHLKRKVDWGRQLWLVFVFNYWVYRHVLGGKDG